MQNGWPSLFLVCIEFSLFVKPKSRVAGWWHIKGFFLRSVHLYSLEPIPILTGPKVVINPQSFHPNESKTSNLITIYRGLCCEKPWNKNVTPRLKGCRSFQCLRKRTVFAMSYFFSHITMSKLKSSNKRSSLRQPPYLSESVCPLTSTISFYCLPIIQIFRLLWVSLPSSDSDPTHDDSGSAFFPAMIPSSWTTHRSEYAAYVKQNMWQMTPGFS